MAMRRGIATALVLAAVAGCSGSDFASQARATDGGGGDHVSTAQPGKLGDLCTEDGTTSPATCGALVDAANKAGYVVPIDPNDHDAGASQLPVYCRADPLGDSRCTFACNRLDGPKSAPGFCSALGGGCVSASAGSIAFCVIE